MALTETGGTISDTVSAQLVDCTPPEPAAVSIALPEPPESTPIRDSLTATVEQTGAGPPPEVR